MPIRPFAEIEKTTDGFQPKDNLISSVTSDEHLDNTNKNSKPPRSLENSLLCTNIRGKGKKVTFKSPEKNAQKHLISVFNCDSFSTVPVIILLSFS